MATPVIDWDEAMQQCGDDEEFLRELLGDLRTETDTQMSQMEIIIQVRFILLYLNLKIIIPKLNTNRQHSGSSTTMGLLLFYYIRFLFVSCPDYARGNCCLPGHLIISLLFISFLLFCFVSHSVHFSLNLK